MENLVKQITVNISLAVEIAAAIIIGAAIIKVLFRYFAMIFQPSKSFSKEALRVEFGSSVAVALELMLGADVLGTAVAPSWSDIGQLGAIAIIRTALNYFLGKELKEIRTT
jgi:uncharacterized membrane protein